MLVAADVVVTDGRPPEPALAALGAYVDDVRVAVARSAVRSQPREHQP